MPQYDGILALERMERAVWKVKARLLRATAAFEKAAIPYAVVGGNAVAAWVEQVDEAAVRATQDVDIVMRRADLESAKVAMAEAGFIYRHVKSIDMFLDGPGAKPCDAVRIVFSGEKVREEDVAPVPDVTDSDSFTAFRVVKLESLVRMKLTSFRDKDRTHIRDMIDVGLIDQSWTDKLTAELARRLQVILDDPDG